MSTDETPDDSAEPSDSTRPSDSTEPGDSTDPNAEGDAADGEDSTRDRLEAEADRAVSEFDENIVDLLAWLLDTETRARIYVYLRQHPHATSDEVADGTGLYPSTVREALAELHDEETVTRRKRQNSGAGNNPYEYTAIAPSDLVQSVVEQVQSQLNTVFNLDRRLRDEDAGEVDDVDPVSITVRDDIEE